jgi:uncharacterized protein involved in exopolysaccharide biosynthesis
MVDAPHPQTDHEPTEETESQGIDLDQIRDIVGFAMRAARRRLKLVAGTFLLVASAGLTIATAMPRTYNARVKLLGQRSSALHILTSPVPGMDQVQDPTRNVGAMIMRRDNLTALAKDANLVGRYEETRTTPLRMKDRVMARIFGPLSDVDKLKMLVFTLESRLDVTTDEAQSTVTISVDWSHPQVAYDLVTLVQKNFLEARYDSDVAVINESIAVLEDHAKNELARVDAQLAEYQRLLAERTPVRPNPAVVAAPRVYFSSPRLTSAPASQPIADPDLTKSLEQTRLRIKALEETQQRTVDSLKQQLLQAQLTLTPMHPTVIALQQQVESLSQPSAELVQLRAEERALMLQIAPPRQLSVPSALPGAGTTFLAQQSVGAAAADAAAADAGTFANLPAPSLERDGTLHLAESSLGSAIRAYEDATGRIDAAKVELDITRAAFKHKYTVMSPAEVPGKPKSSKAQLIGFGSVFGGALLALLLATGLDLLKGTVIETWQVRRRLKLDIVGELDSPSLD